MKHLTGKLLNLLVSKALSSLLKTITFIIRFMTLRRPKKLLLMTTETLKNRQQFDLSRKNNPILKNAMGRSSFVEINNEGITEQQ